MSGHEKTRAALALLEEILGGGVPARSRLDSDTDPDELLLIRKHLVPHLPAEAVEKLWPQVNDPKADPKRRLRPRPPRRGRGSRPEMAAGCRRDRRRHPLGQPAPAGRLDRRLPGGAGISLAPLEKKFKEGDQNQRTVAATSLNDYASDKP